jgi:enoyl-CoA hydratase/carnithine racemase
MLFRTLTLQRKDNVEVINIIGQEDDAGDMTQLANELSELCTEIAWNEKILVVVLTGADEKSFSDRIDLTDGVPRVNEEDLTKCRSSAEPIAKLDRPVIVAINGDAIGQGLELALACDIRIASETLRFGLPQIKNGLIPWDGGTQRMAGMG